MAFSRFLDPKNDFLFKRLFGSEKNKDLLISFINSILSLKGDESVQDVTYLKTNQDPEIRYKKQSAVDVLCTDQRGTQFIIEMQVAKFTGFEERAQYYAAKAYINQMNSGGEYEHLKEVIFIALTDYVMFPHKAAWKSDHVTLDKKTKEQDLKAFSFTFIELPKFTKTIEELETLEDKWVYFFKHANQTMDSQIDAYIGDDVVLRKAFDESTKYSMTEAEWNTYEQELKHERDARAIETYNLREAKAEGKAEGIEEGMEKGMEKGKAEGEKAKAMEVARGILAKKLDIKLIAELTGLTEKNIQTLSGDDHGL